MFLRISKSYWLACNNYCADFSEKMLPSGTIQSNKLRSKDVLLSEVSGKRGLHNSLT